MKELSGLESVNKNVFRKGRQPWSVEFNLFPLWTAREGRDVVLSGAAAGALHLIC